MSHSDMEIQALRQANDELVETLKNLVAACRGIQFGPMCDGFQEFIKRADESEKLIHRFDPKFDSTNRAFENRKKPTS